MKIRGVPLRYVEDLRFATRRIRSVTFANAAELVRRQCLAKTPLADFFSIPLEAIQPRDEPAGQQKKHCDDRQVDEIHMNAPCRDEEFPVRASLDAVVRTRVNRDISFHAPLRLFPYIPYSRYREESKNGVKRARTRISGEDRPVRLFTREGRIVSDDERAKHIHSRVRR